MLRTIPFLSLELVCIVDQGSMHVPYVVKQGGWSFHCFGDRRVKNRASVGACFQPWSLRHCLCWMHLLDLHVIMEPKLEHAYMVRAELALVLVLDTSTGGFLGSLVGNG